MGAPYAERLAGYLVGETGKGDDGSKAVLAYGIELMAVLFAELLVLTFVGTIWGCLPTTLTVCGVVFILRGAAGGAHCTSATRCLVVSVLVFVLMGKGASLWVAGTPATTMLVTIAGLLASAVFMRLAPATGASKMFSSEAYRHRLRCLSVGLVLVITGIGLFFMVYSWPGANNYAAAMAFATLWVALTVTGPGHALIRGMDRVMQCRF